MISSDENLYNQKLTGQFFKNYISIHEDDFMDLSLVSDKTAQDVHPPLYYWLLHTYGVAFENGELTKWTGIGLNIVIFLLIVPLFYLLLQSLIKDRILSVIGVLLWSVLAAAVSDTIFIRMYELLTLIILAIVYINIQIVSKVGIRWWNYLLLIVLIAAGFLTQYLFLFFYIPFVLASLMLSYKMQHSLRSIVIFLISVISGAILAFISFPVMARQLQDSNRGREIVNILDESIIQRFLDLGEKYSILLQQMNDQIFFLIGPIFLLAGIYIVYGYFLKRDDKSLIACYIFFIAIAYLICATYFSPYVDMRYIISIVPLIIITIVYAISHLFSTNKWLPIFAISCLIILAFLNTLSGNITYVCKDVIENFSDSMRDSSVPVVIVVQNERAGWRSNSLFPYLSNKDEIYVFGSEEFTRKNSQMIDDINSDYYLFVDNNIVDNPLEEINEDDIMFTYTYFSIYKIIYEK